MQSLSDKKKKSRKIDLTPSKNKEQIQKETSKKAYNLLVALGKERRNLDFPKRSIVNIENYDEQNKSPPPNATKRFRIDSEESKKVNSDSDDSLNDRAERFFDEFLLPDQKKEFDPVVPAKSFKNLSAINMDRIREEEEE